MLHDMRWLIDGYNVIRRSSELYERERDSLEAGRRALLALLGRVVRDRGDQFTVVFDGAGPGSSTGSAGVRIVFSSARESADRVLIRMASAQGGAVVSDDREVLRAVARVGAVPITAGEFLARLEAVEGGSARSVRETDKDVDDEEPESRAGPRKGNPRRLGKRARAAARALGRLGGRPR
jgi:predicted RNA-binding protein with PIN domain